MISKIAWNATFRKMGAERYWSEWDQFAAMSIDQQRQVIGNRMLASLEYFGSRTDGFAEWKEMATASSIDDVWKHWTSLPIVTKSDLQERFDPTEIIERFGVQGRINSTGGSTGTPTRFAWDAEAQQQRAALQFYCWRKFGWNPGVPVMSIWGAQRELGQNEKSTSKWLRRLRNVTLVDGYEFSQQTVTKALSTIESRKQIAIYGYTTLLEQFARATLENGIKIPKGKVITAWSGGEAVRNDQSELFREAFGVPIHNQYGGREFGAIGYKLDGTSSFKLFRPVIYLEIVNEKNEPCAPGETGRILLTTLVGKGTPFIRYENGDLGTYAEHDMTEAGLIGMSSIAGRTTSIIYLPDGRTLHNMFWFQLFKDYPEIQSFHVHQLDTGSIRVTYRGQPLSPETSAALDHLIRRMLGRVEFSISRVDTLPKTAQGKHLQVTSDFNPGS